MSDDMLLHFSSNSSNQSDQSLKIAKLEARMVGKASSAAASSVFVQAKVGADNAADVENEAESLLSSDSDDVRLMSIFFPIFVVVVLFIRLRYDCFWYNVVMSVVIDCIVYATVLRNLLALSIVLMRLS